jgi:23S rRNA pseudouridine1911/1915/1917 synthase
MARAFADVSRSRLQALARAGHVCVDGAVVRDPSVKVGAGAALAVTIPPAVAAEPTGEAMALDVVYEDVDLIVIDKPAGLVVHPGAGNESGTLVNALIAHCGESLSGIGGVKRPGIVHRLDKDTSGLLVVAKNDAAHQGLAAQFADHGRTGPLERAYLALVWGAPNRPYGTVSAALGRSSSNREKMAVTDEERGRHAVTHFEILESLPPGREALAALLRCTLETGRTHQTKANRLSAPAQQALAALGRQALHAAVLGFSHPRTGETLRFESAMPPAMRELLENLRV